MSNVPWRSQRVAEKALNVLCLEDQRCQALHRLQVEKRAVPSLSDPPEPAPAPDCSPPSTSSKPIGIPPPNPGTPLLISTEPWPTSTPVTPGITVDRYNTQQREDNAFCSTHLQHHIFPAEGFKDILSRMGGAALGERWEAACSRVQVGQTDLEEIERCLGEERSPGENGWKKTGRYWVAVVADMAGPTTPRPDPMPCQFEYVRGSAEPVKHGRVVRSKRRLDIALVRWSATRPICKERGIQWCNILLLGAFTNTELGETAFEAGSGKEASKYQQLVTNMADVLLEQPERIFLAGFAFLSRDLVFCLLDREGLHHYRLENSVGSEQIKQTAALLYVLQTANIYELGCSPIFRYSLEHPKNDFGDITPVQIVLPSGTLDEDSSALVYNILKPPINHLTRAPFHRATTIWPAQRVQSEQPAEEAGNEEKAKTLFVKVQWVADDRVGREIVALECLKDEPGRPRPAWAPELISSFVSTRLRCQLSPATLLRPLAKVPASTPRVPNVRHIEVIVTETLANAAPLYQSISPTCPLIDVMKQLVEAIAEARDRGVLHRDISSGNVLATRTGQLVWIDWECAVAVGSSVRSRQRIGTLDTMCYDALDGYEFQHLPRHELESAIYLFWKTAMTHFKPVPDDEYAWNRAFKALSWGRWTEPETLTAIRRGLWGQNRKLEAHRIAAMVEKQDRVLAAALHGLADIAELDPVYPGPGQDSLENYQVAQDKVLRALC